MKLHLILAFLFTSFGTVSIHAEEVVVFVHGVAGKGVDESGGTWTTEDGRSMLTFIQQQTKLRVFEASVGPFSSNWDRACELYAQIKGLRTDFGKAHSTKYAHERFGRDFTKLPGSTNYYRQGGFFPQWNSQNRIHFVAHSMGGMTVRYLERLIQLGDQEEQALANSGGYGGDQAMSELFKTNQNRDWIASITTLASPHDGSTLVPKLGTWGLLPILKTLVLAIGGAADKVGDYDFDLDHHSEFRRKPGQSFGSWVEDIFSSPKWNGEYEDLCDTDLSSGEMKVFNSQGPRVYPNTRYFAASTFKTAPCWLNWGDQCPKKIKGLLSVPAFVMGSMDNIFGKDNIKDKYGNSYDNKWEPNDGLVPQISSRGPTFGVSSNTPGAPIEHPKSVTGSFVYSKSAIKTGQWYYQTYNFDHSEMKDRPEAFEYVKQCILVAKA